MSKYTYTASPTNTSKDMPLFLTKYDVTFILPPILAEKYGTTAIVDSVQKIEGLDLDKNPEPVSQKYRGRSRRFAGSVVEDEVDLKFTFAVNVTKLGRIYPLDLLRDWCRLIWNKEGISLTKEDYSGSVVIEVTNIKDETVRKAKFGVFFPNSNITEMELNYNEDAIYELEMDFVAEDPDDRYAN
jgi:hypothetical protein